MQLFVCTTSVGIALETCSLYHQHRYCIRSAICTTSNDVNKNYAGAICL